MAETSSDTPEWMLLLENKKKKQHKLAHEIGAGAPCLTCGDSCPGLDLHFWRKLCRNCKCKKEDHDVQEDDDYGKFEILLGNANKRKKHGAFLKIKLPESTKTETKAKSKEVSFDWVPPNVSDDVAAEYMQNLPAAKLPISGSDGALYRRQQLEKQVPLHDLDANHCHNLTPEEIEGLKKYLENLKSNVVGQGRVTKVPVLHATTKLVGGVLQNVPRPLSLSQSADSLRSFATPRPFHPTALAETNTKAHDNPPPLPNSLPPNLKKPSCFLPSGNVYQSNHLTAAEQLSGSSSLRTLDPAIQSESVYEHSQSVKDLPVSETLLSTIYPRDTVNSTLVEGSLAHHSQNLPKNKSNILTQPGMMLNDGSIVSSQNPANYLLHSNVVPGEKYPASYMNASTQCFPPNGKPDIIGKFSKTSDDNSKPVPINSSVIHNPLQQPVNASVDSVLKPTENISHSHNVPSQKFSCNPIQDKDLVEKKQFMTVAGNESSILQPPFDLHAQDRKIIKTQLPNSLSQSTEILGSEQYSSPIFNTQQLSSAFNDKLTATSVCPKVDIAYSNKLPNKEMASLSNDLNKMSTKPHSIHQAETCDKFRDDSNRIQHMEAEGRLTSSLGPHGEIVFSEGVPSDALPKASIALVHRNDNMIADPIDDLSGKMAQMGDHCFHLDCKECGKSVSAGEVAVFADRAGDDTAWHPSCFVCNTCKELLVDLIYFFTKGNVYCGRHFAEMLNIPRCFACDELIFVNEYTMAEEKAFHVRHFCCYECDVPLGGMKYIPVDAQPVCLDCFQEKYGKRCHKCKRQIAAGDQRVSWKDLHWHVSDNCFQCFQCHKSLLGGRFVVKQNQPFCSKECVLAANFNG